VLNINILWENTEIATSFERPSFHQNHQNFFVVFDHFIGYVIYLLISFSGEIAGLSVSAVCALYLVHCVIYVGYLHTWWSHS